jgi:hypothetical protein
MSTDRKVLAIHRRIGSEVVNGTVDDLPCRSTVAGDGGELFEGVTVRLIGNSA